MELNREQIIKALECSGNGSTATVWRTVDRQIYEDALKILETEK